MNKMNRIDALFQTKNKNVLSIYFTAGYPEVDSAPEIIYDLSEAGADIIEIGIPFSDPLADGPVIQKSNVAALHNGMSVSLLFKQLSGIRKKVSVPLIIMSYINPVFKYGIEEFCGKCKEVGIDGVILPDLPPESYSSYRKYFEINNLYNILLISPRTSEARLRMIDRNSAGFVYMVSSSSTTGVKTGFSDDQILFFERIKDLDLTLPRLIGFGISNASSFNEACRMANGAIIGSAFIKMLGDGGCDPCSIRQFISEIRGDHDY
jgi:tryptophan synthase alpha chain